VKGLVWKLGLLTSLVSLPILVPFCAQDRCYDRGGAIDASGTRCQVGPGQVEPLATWSWPLQGWVYFLVVGALPGFAIGAVVRRVRRGRPNRSTA
jgi:hypothetical protein